MSYALRVVKVASGPQEEDRGGRPKCHMETKVPHVQLREIPLTWIISVSPSGAMCPTLLPACRPASVKFPLANQ